MALYAEPLCHYGISFEWNRDCVIVFLKLRFSEKATKFEKIFVVLLTRASCSVRATAYLSKSRRRFFKTNVDKLYYTNFTRTGLSVIWESVWCKYKHFQEDAGFFIFALFISQRKSFLLILMPIFSYHAYKKNPQTPSFWNSNWCMLQYSARTSTIYYSRSKLGSVSNSWNMVFYII